MKKKLLLITALVCSVLFLLPACEISADSSLKSITKPYITQYECTEAKLGNEDLLEKYQYIRITLVDDKNLELNFKTKDGEKHSYEGTYEVDPDTRELTGEIGVLGMNFKEKVVIENGGFTVTKNIFQKTLVIKFKAN